MVFRAGGGGGGDRRGIDVRRMEGGRPGAGAAVAGATVELITEQRTITTTTDGEGGYQFLNVLPGMYKVQVSASGFGTKFRDNVPVELGRTIAANFELAATLAGEQVTITASDEPLVDMTSTKVASDCLKSPML